WLRATSPSGPRDPRADALALAPLGGGEGAAPARFLLGETYPREASGSPPDRDPREAPPEVPRRVCLPREPQEPVALAALRGDPPPRSHDARHDLRTADRFSRARRAEGVARDHRRRTVMSGRRARDVTRHASTTALLPRNARVAVLLRGVLHRQH